MDYEPQKILSQFEQVTRENAREVLVHWWQQYEFNLNRLKSAFNAIKIDLSQSERWKKKPENFWHDIRGSILRLQQWPRSFHLIDEELSLEDFSGKYLNQFEKLLETLPADIRILIGESYWQSSADDKLLIRLRKKTQPVKTTLSDVKLAITNSIRRIRQKPPLQKSANERIIQLHDFLRFYLSVPYTSFLRDEWLRFLQSIFGQFFIIQGHTESLIKKLLILDKMENIPGNNSENIFDDLYEMADIVREIDVAIESLDDYEKQFLYRLKNFWQDTSEKFTGNWTYAGTFLLPGQRYNAQQLEAKRYQLESRLQRDQQLWLNQIAGFLGEWSKNFDISVAALDAINNIVLCVNHIHKNVNTIVGPEIRTASAMVNALNSDMEKVDSIQKLNSIYEAKLVDFSRTRFSQLLDAVSKTGLPDLVRDSLNLLESSIQNLPENGIIFLNRDTSGTPPRSRTREVRLHDLVRYSSMVPFRDVIDKLVSQLLARQEEIFRNISQLGQLVEFQFETAHQLTNSLEKDEPIDEVKLIIRDTLDKTDHLLSEIITGIDETVESTTRELIRGLRLYCTRIITLSDRTQLFEELQRQNRMDKRQKRGKMRKNIFSIFGSLLTGAVTKPVRKLVKGIKKYYNYSPSENAGNSGSSIQDHIISFLAETREKINRLPFIYQKLFLFSPLDDERFYTGQMKILDLLALEFKTWQEGKHGMVAITGETGSGKTTLINMASRELFKENIPLVIDTSEPVHSEKDLSEILARSFNVKNATSLKQIEASIQKKPAKDICIIDNLNLIFGRSVNGLALLQKLLDFLVRTQGQVFWLVTCSTFSWQYLDKTVNIEKYFQKIIRISSISVKDIEEIILNRHKLSGFDLHFEANGVVSENRQFKRIAKDDARQAYLKEIFFDKLNQISAGNITIAMLFWLRSIHEIRGDKTVVDTGIELDYTFLNQLDENELFTLASLTNFEKLTLADHAAIFNQSEALSSLNLDQMCRYGLLVNEDDYYRIHPFLYRHTVELLRSKNILH